MSSSTNIQHPRPNLAAPSVSLDVSAPPGSQENPIDVDLWDWRRRNLVGGEDNPIDLTGDEDRLEEDTVDASV
jgi:hypothetical protein